MRLSTRITLGIILMSATLICLFGFLSISEMRNSLQSMLQKQGNTVAKSIAAYSIEALISEDYPALEMVLRTIGRESGNIQFIEVSRNGKVLASYVSPTPDTGLTSYADISLKLNTRVNKLGEVKLLISDHENKEVIYSRIKQLILFSLAGFFVLSLALHLMLQKLVVLRIEHLKKLTEQVIAAELPDRAEPLQKHTRDEIDVLHERFVGMLEGLQSRDQLRAAMLADITLARAMLTDISEELHGFFNLVPDMLCIASLDGLFLKINPMWKKTLGYNERELLSSPILDFVHPEDQEMMKPGQHGHQAVPLIARFRCKDNSYKWLEWVCLPSADNARLYASARDITPRKRNEAEKEAMERRAAKAKILLHAVLDSTPDWVFAKDDQHRFLFVNRAFATAQGYEPGEMTGRQDADLWTENCPNESLPVGSLHRNDIVLAGQPTHNPNDFATNASGELHIFDTLKVALRDANGQCYGVLAYARDITGRQRAENKLRDLNEQLETLVEVRTQELTQAMHMAESAMQMAESANKVKSDFLAVMSHEIRTPMNSILGMTHLALNSTIPSKVHSYLEKIHISGLHLRGIIEEILDFSKISEHKLMLEKVDFDLQAVLESARMLFEQRISDKGLTFVADIDPAITPCLRGDPLRIGQVLINYLSNAVKFTEKGHIAVRVRKLDENEKGVLLRFEVQDDGIGINEETKSRLFEAFQQADTSTTRLYGGTGLGLSICRQLAEIMDEGAVGVDSTPGVGSTFWFCARLQKASQSPTCKPPSMPDSRLNGVHILVAEDHPFNQEVISEILTQTGAVVRIAENGQEALDLLEKQTFDCVLLDIQMPVLDGLDTARRIRGCPALANLPVIAMTANTSPENRESYLAAGMNDFIGKPFDPSVLYDTIARWVPRIDETPANTADIIDLSVLSGWIGDDRVKLREFTGNFLHSAKQDMGKIDVAIALGEFGTIAKLAHHISSPAKMVGAAEFFELCRDLEKLCKASNDKEGAGKIIVKMHIMLEKISQHLAHL